MLKKKRLTSLLSVNVWSWGTLMNNLVGYCYKIWLLIHNTVSQLGSQRQEQTKHLYWRQSDIAQCAAVKMFDTLHRLNTKHSDFNQVFVHSLIEEPINIAYSEVVSMSLERELDVLLNTWSTLAFQVCFTYQIFHLTKSDLDSTKFYHFNSVSSNDLTDVTRH